MPVIPVRTEDLLNFMDQHGPQWQTSAVALGLSASQGLACKTAAIDARAAFTAHLAAAEASRVATEHFREVLGESRGTFADALRIIKAFAESSGKPGPIYQLAQIPPPAPPSPAPPPGIPTDLRAALEPTGEVSIRWKAAATDHGGIVWTIKRRLPGEAVFSFVGSSGTRKFTDETIPQGTSLVQYQVHGQRGQSTGPACAPFSVQFGSGGGMLTISAQFSGEPPARLAA